VTSSPINCRYRRKQRIAPENPRAQLVLRVPSPVIKRDTSDSEITLISMLWVPTVAIRKRLIIRHRAARVLSE
jgi:hypothetical protein